MVKAVIDDIEQFKLYLARQPLCQWAAMKEADVASGKHADGSKKSGHSAPKTDNSDLAAALSSMA